MKKFLLKVSIFAAFTLVIQVILPVWIDPFNVFHWENIRANGVEPNKNYIKMKYILANPGKFDSFLFGSSRVGVIQSDKMTGEKCYNMTYSLGMPCWHIFNLKTFLKNGIRPKKIYIGVDSISYTEDYKAQINDPLRCPYEYLAGDNFHLLRLYTNAAMLFRSLGAIARGSLGKIELVNTDIFYKYGWGIITKDALDWSKAKPNVGDKVDIDTALKHLREISDICREHGIELIIFTNPMHRITYLASVRDKDYFTFLEGLAEISDFWNFSSLNDITTDNVNYHETSHYRANVGDIMIDVMCNGKSYPKLQAQGFGVKVTKENAKDFITMLRKQAENFTE